jgi:hypothetical protein
VDVLPITHHPEDKMDAQRRRSRTMLIAAVILVPLLVLAAWGVMFAGSVGMLPWQPEPTRISITPFADLPTPAQ